MVIGNGDIASALEEVDRDDLLFFASGVSNSLEIRESEYEREVNLLLNQPVMKHLVYFSSLAVFYSDTRYAWHKKEMEGLVKNVFQRYTIIRLGNITWGNNPNTIINFFKNKLSNNEPIEIRDEYRYVVWLEEFLHWINMIPDWSCEMNIPGEMMKIEEIVDAIKRQEFPDWTVK
jgi:nucleoside-diphosphate-sugar epimerase